MPDLINITGVNWIDVPVTLIVEDFIGEPLIAAMVIMIFLLVLVSLITPRREIILLVPLPGMVALSDLISITWIKITLYMLAGLYLGFILIRVAERDIF